SATKTGSFVPGTDGSNPSPSSGESGANLIFGGESGVCLFFASTTLISSGGTKHKQSLHVPRHGHKAPFALDPIETAQQELPEAQHRLDDAEHRLWHLFA